MTELSLLAAFLIGIAGAVHCIGMCGGITVALQSAVPQQSPYRFIFTLAYHFGRIVSYTLAGALAGWISRIISHASIGISVLTVFSGVMLILLGLYMGNWYRGLRYLEQAGGTVWRHIQPIAKRFIPFKTPFSALIYGGIWGWLPCGLVYSTLVWSMSSGDAISGASLMLAFGLGTLPAMLLVSIGANSIQQLIQRQATRNTVALLLIGYGGFLLFNALHHI